MNSVLKINFLLNIDTLGSCPMPVTNTNNSYLQHYSGKLAPYHLS